MCVHIEAEKLCQYMLRTTVLNRNTVADQASKKEYNLPFWKITPALHSGVAFWMLDLDWEEVSVNSCLTVKLADAAHSQIHLSQSLFVK